MVDNLHLDTNFLQNVDENRIDTRCNISEDHRINKTLPETRLGANCDVQDPPKICIHTLTKENSTSYNRLLKIYNIFPSTKQYDICIYFNITHIVILATCFDSCKSSSDINIQELLVHIVLQFFMS